MRIIQTVNDTIRLLFNPKTEIFTISDFLLVRDVDENFLAQVVEVYDDKFDQEANVAKIKLIYRIVNGKELVPYDNYTPSRECEVAKIKQSEIEKCINLNKETLVLGKSAKSGENVKINTEFFTNNCVIFSDKYEQTNQMFENLAARLSGIKNVLILDFSGSCQPENSSHFTAGENFRMPLSSKTMDYIQQKTLSRAKLETQVVLGDVFEEVKNFLTSTEEDYIPFQRFIKVVQAQCKQTPSVELMVLISWLKKYLGLGIFAKNKREFETAFKSIEKNKITSIDLSNIKTEWQKEFVEFVANRISKDVFLLIRLNDNNINNDIINYLYLKKENISFIPSFSYGFKKAPYIMEFAQNYILMPAINPKRDFSYANFQVQALNNSSYMIFGEATKDFIFVFENEVKVKKKEDEDSTSKMFISLNLQLEDMTPLELRPNDFEIKPVETRKKRLHEEISLKDVLSVEDSAAQEIEPSDELPQYEEAAFEEPQEEVFEFPYEEAQKEPPLAEEAEEEVFEELNEIQEETEAQTEALEEEVFSEDELDFFEMEEIEEPEAGIEQEISVESDMPVIKADEEKEENEFEKLANLQEDEDETVNITVDENDEITHNGEEIEETKDTVSTIIDEVIQEKAETASKQIEEMTQKAQEEEVENSQEETATDINSEEDVNKKFDEILNEDFQNQEEGEVLKINDSVSIDISKVKKEVQDKEPKLPIFNNETQDETSDVAFGEGDKISHEKYGNGEVLKVIKYGTRCLLQIEFEQVGKRLLDPKIAKLKPQDEI